MASQLHIEVSGHGPALVLIHGLALHGGVFAPLVERLAPHFQLHVVDLPGHGRSRDSGVPLRLPFVVQAIARATPPAVWLGWSLGGLFALHAAATLPQVRGVAMIASTPRFIRAEDWPHAAACAPHWMQAARRPLRRCAKDASCWRAPICAAPWPCSTNPACG